MRFCFTVDEDAPFTRTQVQEFLEERGIATRMVWTGNILRQPGFAGDRAPGTGDGLAELRPADGPIAVAADPPRPRCRPHGVHLRAARPAVPALRLSGLAPSAVRGGHRRGDQVVDQPTEERGDASVHLDQPDSADSRWRRPTDLRPSAMRRPLGVSSSRATRPSSGSLDRRTAPILEYADLAADRAESIAVAVASAAIGSRPFRSSVRRSAAPCWETSTLAAEVTREVACRLARSRPRRWSDAAARRALRAAPPRTYRETVSVKEVRSFRRARGR